MFCKHCGAKISKDSSFCKKCGLPINLSNDNSLSTDVVDTTAAPQEIYPPDSSVQYQEGKITKRIFMGMGASLMVIVYLGGAIIYLLTIVSAFTFYGILGGILALLMPVLASIWMFFIALYNGIWWFVISCILYVAGLVVGAFLIGFSSED